jgi:NADPH2:quinone reductase
VKDVGYKRPLPISDPDALLVIELPIPEAKGKDLLVEVKAISVNPADAKLRAAAGPLPGDVGASRKQSIISTNVTMI